LAALVLLVLLSANVLDRIVVEVPQVALGELEQPEHVVREELHVGRGLQVAEVDGSAPGVLKLDHVVDELEGVFQLLGGHEHVLGAADFADEVAAETL